MSLHVLAYNLKRMMKIMGTGRGFLQEILGIAITELTSAYFVSQPWVENGSLQARDPAGHMSQSGRLGDQRGLECCGTHPFDPKPPCD
jgi:hypothetical protein